MNIFTKINVFRLHTTIILPMIAFLLSSQSQAALLIDLDATVFESVSADPVTQWTNQAGNQYHAITTKGIVRYPTSYMTAAGLPGLDFTGGCNQMDIMRPGESKRILDFSDGTGGFAVIMVFTDLSSRNIHNQWSALIGNAVINSEGFYIRYHAKNDHIRFSLAGNKHIGKISKGDTVLVGLNYDADTGAATATVVTSSGNRETINVIIPAQDFSTKSALSIGNAVTKSRYLDGLISKVMVYDNELSDGGFSTEMQRLEQIWLAPGSTTIPQTRTVIKTAPNPTRVTTSSNPFPTTLMVDLDATISGSIFGSSVTEWADQSGNQFHAKTTQGTVHYPSSYSSASGLIGVDFSGGPNRMKIMNSEASKRLLDLSDGTGGFSILVAFTDQPNRNDHTEIAIVIANNDKSSDGFFIRYREESKELEVSLSDRQTIGIIADGDTVIVGLNYDADTGSYTAKMITSSGKENTITGTIPPNDFSTDHELSLGNATFNQRHLEGMIGKVLIYGNELSEADFLDKMQSLAQIWINPKAKTLGLLLF